MLVSEALTRIKRAGFDDSDPVLLWLNAAIHEFEVEHDWTFLDGHVEVVVPSGIYTFVVPGSTGASPRVISVSTMDGDKLKEWEISRMERENLDRTVSGKPQIYTVFQDMDSATTVDVDQLVMVWPVPAAETIFNLYVQATWADVVSTPDARLPGPIQCHNAIVSKAKAIALQEENEEDRANSALDQYNQQVMKLASRFGKSTLDEPGSVVDTQGYGHGRRSGRRWPAR